MAVVLLHVDNCVLYINYHYIIIVISLIFSLSLSRRVYVSAIHMDADDGGGGGDNGDTSDMRAPEGATAGRW